MLVETITYICRIGDYFIFNIQLWDDVFLNLEFRELLTLFKLRHSCAIELDLLSDNSL